VKAGVSACFCLFSYNGETAPVGATTYSADLAIGIIQPDQQGFFGGMQQEKLYKKNRNVIL